ncbi:hypothetical protein EV700_2298 [Fluviicoccus keumensis]|uniref:LPP20 lipoprotein n=1 Tax=Fluviicoccus keumensis TaxID=1435465 RepID=A0A4Q7YLC9_9GAMM|nr:hypothetical protein [Fluviicoccus keumensis]RZU38367.1 hypothetical protein EV700_2298 [Fluviicoccus keumensis]
MNMRKPWWLLTVVALGGALPPDAAMAWSHLYTTTYLMGDNDSRLTARQHAVERIQQQAAQESGSYIHGRSQLVNDRLDEEMTRESLAVVQVEVVYERFEMTASGQLQLSLQAKASVDDALLRERVAAMSAPSAAPSSTVLAPPAVVNVLGSIREQQQRLEQDNRQLREQLETLARRPVVVEAKRGALAAPVAAGEGPDWLAPLLDSLQGLPVKAQIVTSATDAGAGVMTLGVRTGWRLSLAKDSPLERLCQDWQCAVGYAYRDDIDDRDVPPLHQQLYRPISRPAKMEDKLLNHWRLLTLQATPRHELAAGELRAVQARLMSSPWYVQTRVADRSWRLPLLTWNEAMGGLVISLQGTVDVADTPAYDSQTGQGRYLCTPAYKGGNCYDRLPAQFALQTVAVSHAALKQNPVLEAKVISP